VQLLGTRGSRTRYTDLRYGGTPERAVISPRTRLRPSSSPKCARGSALWHEGRFVHDGAGRALARAEYRNIRWARTRYTGLRSYGTPQRAGHFAACEAPGEFVGEVRAGPRALI
jgi:hypothetical protein